MSLLQCTLIQYDMSSWKRKKVGVWTHREGHQCKKTLGECYEKARIIIPQAKVYLGQKLKEAKKDSSTVLRERAWPS